VKKIWTPSWVLFSGGWAFLFLALFYLVMDVWRLRGWAFVLKVVGMNSIAAYLIAHLFDGFIAKALPRHLGPQAFRFAGKEYEPLIHGIAVLLVEWLLLWWMYRRKLFLRV
jgi:predicted acyltransferase